MANLGSQPRKKSTKVVIIVENLPVPNDRRVWLEASTLQKNGYQVSVISIKGKNATEAYKELDGIKIYRYNAPPQTSGTLSFIYEFFYCWIMTFFLSLRIWIKDGFDIIHACNPPETFWLIGLFYKMFGKKFIFDHHDLSPEMYYSRFGNKGLAYKLLILLEKLTFKTADVVVTTNDTHKKIAIERGGFPAEKIFVVRSGPDHNVLQPMPPNPSLKKDKAYMLSYLGVLNPQDGVETFIYVADYLVNQLNQQDIHFVIMGSGDSEEILKDLTRQLRLTEYFTFTGWAELNTIREYLSTSDICVDTMPKTPYSDAATMNKILEYMAVARPVVAFDLVETRVSAQQAAIYAEPDNVADMALKIVDLLHDPQKCAEMGQFGRSRIESELAWAYQSKVLLKAYSFLEEPIR